MTNSIMWVIHASLASDKEGKPLIEYGQPVVKLEWGWTAGLTQEQMANIAEDAPTGSEEVVTTFEDAKALRDQLSQLIEDYEKNS